MEKELREQTAFETGGIPTPTDQESMAATDPIANAVAGIMDNLEEAFTGEPADAERTSQRNQDR